MSLPSFTRWVPNEGPEGGAGRALGDPGGPHRVFHGPLEHTLGKVRAPPLAGRIVDVGTRGREYPRIGPGLLFTRWLAVERLRSRNPACALGDIGLVLLLRGIDARA